MDESELLQWLGLTPSQVALYRALLQDGSASIRSLATATQTNRGRVYEDIKRLVEAGLVSFTRKSKQRRYVAERPAKIRDLVSEKHSELQRAETAMETLIPQLSSLAEPRSGEPVVRFYEDDEGVVAILRDVLQTVSKLPRKEYHVYSSRPLRRYIYRRFPNFTRRRLAEGIFAHVIAIGEGGDPVESAERRWLPEPTDEKISSYILIYGDKVALISVSADDTPYGVMIEEPGVAAMQRYVFAQAWQVAKPGPS